MVSTVYVHIGPHKSGTTFIQQVLVKNRRLLADGGVLFPGSTYGAQRQAVLQLLHTRRPNRDGRVPLGLWDELVADVRAWRGDRAVISVENLDKGSPRLVQRLVEDFAPADVHVIYTARDLTQVIPAMWQTRMRNRNSQPWTEYIDDVRNSADTSEWPWHLRGQDPRLVFERWESYIPRAHMHVITVPRSGSPPNLLWQRFCSVVGLQGEHYSLDVRRLNRSMGSAESELLRRLNARLGGRLSRRTYDRWVQVFIARHVLEPRAGQTKLRLPAQDHVWAREYAEEIVRFLQERDYEVTGDLGELLPPPPPREAADPDTVGDAAVLDAALDALAGLLTKIDHGPAGGAGRGVVRPETKGLNVARRLRRRARTSLGRWRGRGRSTGDVG